MLEPDGTFHDLVGPALGRLLQALRAGTDEGSRVLFKLKRCDGFVKLLLAASVALELRGQTFAGIPTDRDAEKLLVILCAHMLPDSTLWRDYGDTEFLVGVAVMLAGHTGYDCAAYLTLAESLQSDASTLERYEAWYRKYRPDFSRLLAMVDRERRTHARVESQTGPHCESYSGLHQGVT